MSDINPLAGWLAGWAVAGRARATHAVEKVRIVDRCHRFSDDFGSQSQLNAAMWVV